MDIPQIENGKKPDEAYHVGLMMWLPPNSPYGNLQRKPMLICSRLDEANRRLEESWKFWRIASGNEFPPNPINAFERHYYANEQAIFLIRRATDEIISLVWCLSQRVTTGSYPEQIKIDCIGAVLKQPLDQRLEPFKNHETLFQQLNEIANAFKHSFVNSDITLIGQNEPSVYASSLNHNKISAGIQFHGISLAALVTAFNPFYKDSIVWLREFTEKNRSILEQTFTPIS